MSTTDTEQPGTAEHTKAKRTRRAEPINTHTARNGTVTYWFQIDVGTKPDGSRDRRKFSYPTKAEARKALRRIATEVSSGTYSKPTAITVNEACDDWLARPARHPAGDPLQLRERSKPVRRFLGGKRLQQLTKADGDNLVERLLTEGRTSPRHYRPDSLAGRVAAMVAEHPEGITAAELAAAFPAGDVHSCLAALLAAGRVTRLRRGVYAPGRTDRRRRARQGLGRVAPADRALGVDHLLGGCAVLCESGCVAAQRHSLVERPKYADHDDDRQADTDATHKSWTLAEVQQFRDGVRHHRLYACWLLSCYGLRRSEVLGLRWSAVDLDAGVLSVRRGRVAVGTETVEGAPKSQRSRRDLPLPAELTEALRALRTRQQTEAMELGRGWSDDRLVAVDEAGTPLRPESYTDEFQRLRARAALRRIKLHGLRNTSGTLMLDAGHPVHIVARWHGHDPAVLLSIYSDAKQDELRAASASLFG